MTELWGKWLWSVPVGCHRLSDFRIQIPGKFAVDDRAWITVADLEAQQGAEGLVDSDGSALLWGNMLESANLPMRTANSSFLIQHPWQLLQVVEAIVGAMPRSSIAGEVHPLATVEGTLQLGSSSRILPGVFIEGHAVIGNNCKIGPNAYIRGCTAIADHCHVGNAVEIKNSLLMSHTCVGHLSYVGDSILGQHVNFGAGTITANFRHDGANGKSIVAGQLVDTGRLKLGAMIGDGVHTGIHTSIYPERRIDSGMSTLPGEVVAKDRLH